MTIVLPNNVDYTIEYYNGAWVDMTAYVVSDFDVEQGMSDDSYDTRLADPATVTFDLNNKDNVFTLTAFKKGTLIRCQVTYDGRTQTKFYGQVEQIEPDAGTTGEKRLHVTCTDWLNHTLGQLVRERPVEIEKRFDEGISTLMSDMPIQPISTLIDSGITIFPTIYDQIDRNTTVYQEINRLIISEYGYGYMDRGGERFRVENRNARGSLKTIKVLPKAASIEYLKKVDGDFLLKIDGDKILLNTNTQDADFDTTVSPEVIQSIKVLYGGHILNEVEFVAYPKAVDDSAQIVFLLSEPFFVPALSTETFEGYFSDPRGQGHISASDFEDIVATTDFLANELADGSGTNLTSNITVTPTYYADRVKLSFYNAGEGAWITFLRVRGLGIYPDNPVSAVKEDQTSKDQFGVLSLQIRQPYQQSIESGANEAERILDQEREAREVAILVSCIANASDFNMQAFLHLDIGDLIHIKTTKPALDSHYFIQGMRWRIDWATKIIYYTYILKERPEFEMFAIDYSPETNSQNGIDFQRPPELNNINPCTFFVRVYQKDLSVGNCPLMGKYSASAQKVLVLRDTGKLTFIQGFTGVVPQWTTTDEVMDDYIDEWTTVAVTYDSSSIANDPIFYVNGVPVTLVEDSTPTGVAKDDSKIKFILNNGSFVGSEWVYESSIVCKDYRVYNRILSSSEINDLDANDDPDYNTTGLIFQAPFARNFRITDYIDQPLMTDDKVFDRISQAAGTPHFNPASSTYWMYGRDPDDTSF